RGRGGSALEPISGGGGLALEAGPQPDQALEVAPVAVEDVVPLGPDDVPLHRLVREVDPGLLANDRAVRLTDHAVLRLRRGRRHAEKGSHPPSPHRRLHPPTRFRPPAVRITGFLPLPSPAPSGLHPSLGTKQVPGQPPERQARGPATRGPRVGRRSVGARPSGYQEAHGSGGAASRPPRPPSGPVTTPTPLHRWPR